MSGDYVQIRGFHPALDGQYFECSGTNGSYDTAALGRVVEASGITVSIGDLKRIGDVYIYRNYTVTITVDWHDEGEFSIMLRSADDPDFWYSIQFGHHDFFTVAVAASRCYLGVLHKYSYDSCGELTRVKRRDYRIADSRIVSVSNWASGCMVDSSKYCNDVLVKHRHRNICSGTYCEILERIENETVVMRVMASGTVGNKSSHAAFEVFTIGGAAPAQYPGIEVYAL